MKPISPRAIRSLFLLAFISAAIALWTLTPIGEYASVEGVRSLAQNQDDSWGVFFLFVAIFAFGNFFFLPIPLITFAASLIFPLWKVLVCGLVGVGIAALLGYAAGRFLELKHWPESFRKVGTFIADRLSGQAMWAVILLRVAPTPPFTVTSMVAGSCRFHVIPFLIGSLLGVVPLMMLVGVLGDTILQALEKPSTFSALLVGAVLVMILMLHFASKRSRRVTGN